MNFLPFQGMEARRQIGDCLHFAFVLFFLFDCSLVSLPRIHLKGRPHSPHIHPTFYDRCFSFSFSKPNFSLRKFFHFLIFFSQGWKFLSTYSLSGRPKLSRLPLNLQASALCVWWKPALGNFSRLTFTNFTFQPLHFGFRSSLFLPIPCITFFLAFRWKMSEDERASKNFHTLSTPTSLSRTLDETFPGLRSPFSKKKIFIQ